MDNKGDIKKFIKRKLQSKIDIILLSKGENLIKIPDNILDNVGFGNYEIIWNYNADRSVILGLKKLSDHCKISTSNGLYHIEYVNGPTGIKHLYSSQFIKFDIKEYREEKLNYLLDNK